MAIDTNFSIKETTLNRMVDLAFKGRHENSEYLDSALRALNSCKLSEEQSAKIASILGNVPSATATLATTEMKERILAVLSGDGEVLEVAPNGQIPVEPAPQITTLFHPEPGQFIDDILQTIFLECQSKRDWESIEALTYVNKNYNQSATKYWKQFDLKLFCPELTILDAKTQGITVDDEPCVSKLAILKGYRDLAPHVESNRGLTLLTMAKGLTLKQLMEIAAKAGMKVRMDRDRLLPEHGHVQVKQTYVILITNSVFLKSRTESFFLKQWLVAGHECKMPTVQEYVALCVFTNKCFQKCHYGRNPWTFGHSSTHVYNCYLFVGGSYLFVGDSASYCLDVEFDRGSGHGCGGRRMFIAKR